MKNRTPPLNRFAVRVTLAMICSMLFVVALSNLLIYQFALNSQFKNIRSNLMVIAQTAALMVDPDLLVSVPLNKEGIHSLPYQIIADQLRKIRMANPQIAYIYVMTKTNEDGVWQFAVDPDPDKDAGEDG